MKKVAFLTSSQLPQGTADDRLMLTPLNNLGIKLSFVEWDDLGILENQCHSYDLVVIRSPWDYLGRIQEFLGVCKNLKNVLNDYSVVKWNIHKGYLLEIEKKGLPIIPMENLKEYNFNEPIETDRSRKLVVKPYVSASSFRTVLFEGNPPEEVLKWKEEYGEDYLVQPFCDSIKTEGERSFIFFNDGKDFQFSHAALKKPQTDDFRVQEEFGGSTSFLRVSPSEVEWAKRFCWPLVGKEWLYARVDLVYYGEKWCLSELEVIEPDLYLRIDEESPERFSYAINKRLAH